jgi:hypothetical protein
MNDVDLYLLRGELDKRVFQCLYRAIDITLDDDIEFLEVAQSDTASELVEGKQSSAYADLAHAAAAHACSPAHVLPGRCPITWNVSPA